MAAPLLSTIHGPADLRRLPQSALPQVAAELRSRIIEVVSEHGGHFASSLGAVELILGMHYVFDTPRDKLLWDMGYQAYAHKLLTGRQAQFHTIKQWGGLSGFSNPEESEHDLFATGHGGTCISTALGMAEARDLSGDAYKVVAIIGDASLGEGMALEALNHAGHLKRNLLVILNDNQWSISPSVGAISKYLTRIITGPVYNRFRDDFEKLMRKLPQRAGTPILRVAKRLEEGMKGFLTPGVLFEELGFRYFGPIDGNDLNQVVRTLRNVAKLTGSILVHVITKKGKGYAPAEQDPERFHKTEAFDAKTGTALAKAKKNGRPSSFTEAFSKTLVKLAERDPRIVAISAAMMEGTGLDAFQKRFPQRCFDVGMAEQHGMGFAAGLARMGYKPVIALYSTFLHRAYDQVFHEVCLQRVPVTLILDRAGLVGEDGPTHHGVFDIGFLRNLPNLTFLSPRDEEELTKMLEFAMACEAPVAIRYPRSGSQLLAQLEPELSGSLPRLPVAEVYLGRAELLREGGDVALIALGPMTTLALQAAQRLEAEGINATVVNARFIKPLDLEMLRLLAQSIPAWVTVEEAVDQGGFGSAVMEAIEQEQLRVQVRRLALPTEFMRHGTRAQLLRHYGLTASRIVEMAQALVADRPPIRVRRRITTAV
ncbi:MAG: 1-deoxy-D-xylulose-5-phosphate synthase [Candidatus Omnitrophica bacterium]|nr:1-deoxy-D-xylulose-5-phosphate synthase [Candidatus Omnitrophota bacterium]